MTFSWIYPSGAEDVGWWESNRSRVNQQIQLGMVGSIARIAGSIQPVAVVEDLSALDSSRRFFWFGGTVGSPIVGRVAGMEINAPGDGTTAVFVHQIGHIAVTGNTNRRYLYVRAPSPATGLAVLSANITELDEQFQQYSQAHRSRVFIGSTPNAAINISIGNHQHGLVSYTTDNKPDNNILANFAPHGLQIPPGRNLVFANDYDSSGGVGVNTSFWCVVSEFQAPMGPV